MTNIVHMEPLTTAKYETYIAVGSKAYEQHYQHLWKNKNTSPYIKSSFTVEVLLQEERDENTSLFLINKNAKPVGILKFTTNSSLEEHSEADALYVDKIYILNESTGSGVGKKVLQFVLLRAAELHKKLVWLDAMQSSPALSFYLKNGFKIHSEKMLHFPEALDSERPMYILTKEI